MGKRNVKTIVALFMVFILASAMVGCGGSNGGTDSNEKSKAEDSVENGKVLVAYFSYSGNTKKIAEEIQSKTGADMFEIKTVNAYSDDYNTVLDDADGDIDQWLKCNGVTNV